MASKHQPNSAIHLDGTTLEGGGQLFRLALSLSSITRKAIHITDIRGKRAGPSRPGEASGIKPAHYAGAAWLARATKARTEGLEVKSREILFDPSLSQASPGTSGRPNSAEEDSDEEESLNSADVWKNIVENGELVRRETSISMQTPGSVYLVLQAILPYILFSSASASTSNHASTAAPVPLRVVIEGGTNVWHSLSHEYADQVLFPILHHKLGFGPFNLTLHKRGWSIGGRNSIGRIQLDISPNKPGTPLPTFSLSNSGEISAFQVSILAPDLAWRTDLSEFAHAQIIHRWPDTRVSLAVNDFSGHEKRIYLLIVAESENGYRLGRDWLYDEKILKDKPKKTIERIVKKVVGDLEREIEHGGCVDEWLQDQLVVFQALAEGKSVVEGGEPSLHTKTARWVAESILDVEFSKSGRCRGAGFIAGSDSKLIDRKESKQVEEGGCIAEVAEGVEEVHL